MLTGCEKAVELVDRPELVSMAAVFFRAWLADLLEGIVVDDFGSNGMGEDQRGLTDDDFERDVLFGKLIGQELCVGAGDGTDAFVSPCLACMAQIACGVVKRGWLDGWFVGLEKFVSHFVEGDWAFDSAGDAGVIDPALGVFLFQESALLHTFVFHVRRGSVSNGAVLQDILVYSHGSCLLNRL